MTTLTAQALCRSDYANKESDGEPCSQNKRPNQSFLRDLRRLRLRHKPYYLIPLVVRVRVEAQVPMIDYQATHKKKERRRVIYNLPFLIPQESLGKKAKIPLTLSSGHWLTQWTNPVNPKYKT